MATMAICCWTPRPPPPLSLVQAALRVGSVNFRTVDFGGAFFSWSYCVLCVLCTLVLRCTMFIFCFKEADWGMMALYHILPLGFQNNTPCLSACTIHSVMRKQHPCPSNTGRWFRQYMFIYCCLDKVGGGYSTIRQTQADGDQVAAAGAAP